jgi:hypothetical protein
MLQYSKGASFLIFLILLGFSSSQLEIGGKRGGALFNPFLFIKNKRLFISSEGFSTLEKNALICYQRAMLPIQSGVTVLGR